ncbi:hypothetical protein G7046_g3131 [Stylonectria norvegica]|nr:hypothetical protein G7046_g3131 [Stylonectria norvegica]
MSPPTSTWTPWLSMVPCLRELQSAASIRGWNLVICWVSRRLQHNLCWTPPAVSPGQGGQVPSRLVPYPGMDLVEAWTAARKMLPRRFSCCRRLKSIPGPQCTDREPLPRPALGSSPGEGHPSMDPTAVAPLGYLTVSPLAVEPAATEYLSLTLVTAAVSATAAPPACPPSPHGKPLPFLAHPLQALRPKRSALDAISHWRHPPRMLKTAVRPPLAFNSPRLHLITPETAKDDASLCFCFSFFFFRQLTIDLEL